MKAPRKPQHFDQACSLTHQQALDIYNTMPAGTSLNELHRKLIAEGHKVSKGRLSQWKRKHNWSILSGDGGVLVSKMTATTRLATLLTEQARLLTSEVVRGINVDVILKIHDTVSNVKIENTEDFGKMVASIEKLLDLEHRLVGDSLTRAAKATNGAKPNTGPVSLVPPATPLSSYLAKAKTGTNGNGYE